MMLLRPALLCPEDVKTQIKAPRAPYYTRRFGSKCHPLGAFLAFGWCTFMAKGALGKDLLNLHIIMNLRPQVDHSSPGSGPGWALAEVLARDAGGSSQQN